MKAFVYEKLGLENLTLTEQPMPQPAAGEVVVKFHAASLNYRDLLFAQGRYNPRPKLPAVPLSDGAGEVTAVGPGVTRWKIGDRVCPIFRPGWIDGPFSVENDTPAIGGGAMDGVLREYGAFDESALVRIPDALTYAEAATLPCAAVTAWHALVAVGALKPGETILTLGSGGVSVFAIQFARLHGARVIATSGSDEKLKRLRELGASETINYRKTPNWEEEVRRLTGGRGVDRVVEVGGAGTLTQSLKAVCAGGVVVLIGVLTMGAQIDPMPVLGKGIRLHGILVGSRHMFEEMNRAISVGGIKPVIDRTFPFAEARQALEYLQSGAHFGKIVLQFD